MTSQVAAVRQNLKLIVDHGQVPDSVDSNVEAGWGYTLGGGYYVWRSGIGITSDGRVIFVYGPALDVRQLATLLQHAGAVEGMQLDINPFWTTYRVLPGRRPAVGPHPGEPPSQPAGRGGPVLLRLEPRLHRGVRQVTANEAVSASAEDELMVAESRTELAAPRPAAGRLSARWWTAVLREARPRQWPKNLLVFAAPLAGATMGRPDGTRLRFHRACFSRVAAASSRPRSGKTVSLE